MSGEPGVHVTVGRGAIAVSLAAVAGFVDAVGYLVLDLFPAHMSGNSTRLGVYVGRGMLSRAAPAAFAVVLFVASIAAGTLMMELGSRRRRRSAVSLVLLVELALLLFLASFGAAVTVHGVLPRAATVTYYGLAACAVVAMGLQTSTLQRISGRTVRTTYVSGMLTNLAEEIVTYTLGRRGQLDGEDGGFVVGELGMKPGRPALRRIALIGGIWLGYAVGAVSGAVLHHRWQLHCLAVPIALLVVVAVAARLTPDPFDRGS